MPNETGEIIQRIARTRPYTALCMAVVKRAVWDAERRGPFLYGEDKAQIIKEAKNLEASKMGFWIEYSKIPVVTFNRKIRSSK